MDDRPLVTYAVFAYRQEGLVRAAVEAALAQTYTPLQIIVSDDHSPDDTFAVMQATVAAYTGPHTIVLNRNPRNLGIGAHINRIMELAEGELVVIAAGDDTSVPHRTQVLVDAWLAGGKKAHSLYSGVVRLDENGASLGERQFTDIARLNDLADVARHGLGLHGASHAWSRAMFERFGPLMPQVVHEDICLTLRSLLLGPVVYVDAPLVHWRLAQSTWHDMHGQAGDIAEMRRRSAILLRLDHIDAMQAHADAERFGDARVIGWTRTRLIESLLILQIAEGHELRARDLVSGVLAGADVGVVVKSLVKFKSKHLYRMLLERRARRDTQRARS